MNYYKRTMDWGTEKIMVFGVGFIMALFGLDMGVTYTHNKLINDKIICQRSTVDEADRISFNYGRVSSWESDALRQSINTFYPDLLKTSELNYYYELPSGEVKMYFEKRGKSEKELSRVVQDIIAKSGLSD